jgi:hypothetical protein
MRFRNLRIAWSAFWALTCILLLVLWARSYWWYESIGQQIGQTRYGGALVRGAVMFNRIDVSRRGVIPTGYSKQPASKAAFEREPILALQLTPFSDGSAVVLPIWFPVVVSIALAAAPRIATQFSLRTLLLAMMLAAVLLGLLAWMIRATFGAASRL